MSVLEEWYTNKDKTYWKTWDVTDTQFPDGAVHWILFIKEDDFHPPYYYGVETNASKAEQEIKFAIGSYLKSMNLL